MKAMIAILPGDGIGTEVTREAVKTLRAVEQKFGHSFELREGLIGDVYMSRGLCFKWRETIGRTPPEPVPVD